MLSCYMNIFIYVIYVYRAFSSCLHHCPSASPPTLTESLLLNRNLSYINFFCLLSCSLFLYNSLSLIRIDAQACREHIYWNIGSSTVLHHCRNWSYIKLDPYLMVYTCHHNTRQNTFTTTRCM